MFSSIVSLQQDPNGRDVILIPVMLNCKSQRTMIWLSIIYIYKGVLMVIILLTIISYVTYI